MPDHDLFDLDDAFSSLERDISTISSPRGAGQALATARRRRRRATYGGVAASVLLVAGVAVGATGIGGSDHSISPADQLPAPAPLDGPHLTAATSGWTPAWTVGEQKARQKIALTFGGDCLQPVPGGRGANTVLGNDHGDVAVALMGVYGAGDAQEAADWRQVEHKMTRCPGAAEVSSFDDPSGASGRTYRVDPTPSETAPQYVWIVSTGQAIGVMKIFDQTEPMPSANDRRVADALLAAVQDPAAFDQNPTASDSPPQRIDPAQSAGQVWSEALEPALAGWSTPWNPQLPRDSSQARTDLSLPDCAGQPDGNDQGRGLTVNVGTDGFEWVHWFDSQTSAVQAVDDLQQALAGCSTPYDVHTVTLPSGRPVVVAAGPQVVLWFTRVASHVLVLQVPAGDTAPSNDVSIRVGAVLEHVLEQPATTTVSPDGHTKVPTWMQEEIAAAPTFGP